MPKSGDPLRISDKPLEAMVAALRISGARLCQPCGREGSPDMEAVQYSSLLSYISFMIENVWC